MPKNFVLLTATITPPQGAANLTRIDPELRKGDYLKAFAFYRDLVERGVIDGLVFCDNSSSDLGFLEEARTRSTAVDKIELMSFAGLNYPPSYDRAYGEFLILDYAMRNSRTFLNMPSDSVVWKATGRYVVSNLQKIIATRPHHADFYIQCRKYPAPWADLFVMAWTKTGHASCILGSFQRFGGVLPQGKTGEKIFYEFLENTHFDARVVRRFKTVPEIVGVRGWDGKSYESMKAKILLRKVLNAVLPWLWV